MTLSKRAQATGEKAKGALLWEIMPNIWDPKSNPDGYVSLGVAENSLMHDELSKHIHDYFALSHAAFTYGDGMTGFGVNLELRYVVAISPQASGSLK
ncbi:Pyridoxal phosphate-dependent transferase, major domain [Fusarium oxysporum f. sp. vasinfectum]|nr:Pyridoxal phosphate-dependent transferase, major domain [Fusarium oxysporum f. sp. vasinfectum]